MISFSSDVALNRHNLLTTSVAEPLSKTSKNTSMENMLNCESYKAELALLDLFSGCGGMSTGLCLGAKLSCVELVTVLSFNDKKFYFLVHP